VHFRVGGSAGTKLQSDTCSKTPSQVTSAKPECEGAFLLFHVTASGSVYVENCWFWVADHELDLPDHNQINLYNGRGVLLENNLGPVWMWGTASEHNVLYNYQISHAKSVFMGHIQTETPYYQSNPDASTPFPVNSAFSDPDLTTGSKLTKKAWGVRILDSSDVFIYGSGMYSFFENYDQECLKTQSCQDNMVSVESSSNIFFLAMSTKAATNMLTLDGMSAILDRDNRNNFCATVAYFENIGAGRVDTPPAPVSSETVKPVTSAPPVASSPVQPPVESSPPPVVVPPASSAPGVVTTGQPPAATTAPPAPTLPPPSTPETTSTPPALSEPSPSSAAPPAVTTAPIPDTPGLIPGYTPGIEPGFTPGVVPGFIPGVIEGFTPGVVKVIIPGTTMLIATPTAEVDPVVTFSEMPAAPTDGAGAVKEEPKCLVWGS
jgi:hypothetical protein